jgi:hypothetical protein
VSDVGSNKVDFGQHSVFTIVFLSIVYAILSLSAFTGNSLVIWIISKNLLSMTSHKCTSIIMVGLLAEPFPEFSLVLVFRDVNLGYLSAFTIFGKGPFKK